MCTTGDLPRGAFGRRVPRGACNASLFREERRNPIGGAGQAQDGAAWSRRRVRGRTPRAREATRDGGAGVRAGLGVRPPQDPSPSAPPAGQRRPGGSLRGCRGATGLSCRATRAGRPWGREEEAGAGRGPEQVD